MTEEELKQMIDEIDLLIDILYSNQVIDIIF